MSGLALLVFLTDTALGVLIFLAIAGIVKLWAEQADRAEQRTEEATPSETGLSQTVR